MTATPQVALVTGASSGIGKAATLALAKAGFRVIGTSRDTSRIAPGDGGVGANGAAEEISVAQAQANRMVG
ncbi:short chain dehydrogenase [Lentzea albidocapillata subsp. violacea]|uniref:Short chain dehydrogenase n=1 Tax=Lentzea albidocapillata subsp. violacea TaxID=128104 RepID=A0A1G8XJY8_9PSEU|nr:SDR family NAD(P)-dependent oxidoreductase [Lentzea albidocapillata]SDJ90918.1 short chain dehydrogenase [Lentzea albidocapillata subsp. violacea]